MTMLKQILATTAVVALAAMSVQSASAAARQIPGAPANDLLITKNGKPFIPNNKAIAQPPGIPTPPSEGGGKPAGNPPELVVPPGGGIPAGVSGPVGGSASGAVVAGSSAAPAAAGPALPPPVNVGPAASSGDNGGAAASPATADAAPAKSAPAVQTPMNLYSVLLAHGYGVVILNSDAYGDLVFYVTTPGYAGEADLLLVDPQYGRVLERKHIAAYTYDYDQTPDYPARYAPIYAGNDNCDHYAGY
jgi:hypothetical protein